MKKSLLLSLLILLTCAPAAKTAQDAGRGHFAKDGLSFDYPEGWTLTDRSNGTAQHLILSRVGNSVLIMVVAYRDVLTNSRQIAAGRENITKPYAEGLARQLGMSKPPDWSSLQCQSLGEGNATGFRLSGRLEGEPSTGEVYAAVLGRRYVNVVYVREDKDDAQGAPAWQAVLESIKVGGPPNAPPPEDELRDSVLGGVLNGKVTKKPQPDFPTHARSAGASGVVVVQIVVDERGDVVYAQALSGHSMLRAPSEAAAHRAKFKPTTLCGRPVKVSGVITYNFVLQ